MLIWHPDEQHPIAIVDGAFTDPLGSTNLVTSVSMISSSISGKHIETSSVNPIFSFPKTPSLHTRVADDFDECRATKGANPETLRASSKNEKVSRYGHCCCRCRCFCSVQHGQGSKPPMHRCFHRLGSDPFPSTEESARVKRCIPSLIVTGHHDALRQEHLTPRHPQPLPGQPSCLVLDFALHG